MAAWHTVTPADRDRFAAALTKVEWLSITTDHQPVLMGADAAGFLIYEPGSTFTVTIEARIPDPPVTILSCDIPGGRPGRLIVCAVCLMRAELGLTR